jgi:hypothetical protein
VKQLRPDARNRTVADEKASSESVLGLAEKELVRQDIRFFRDVSVQVLKAEKDNVKLPGPRRADAAICDILPSTASPIAGSPPAVA